MGGAVLGSAALLNRDDDSVSALNETQRQLSFVHDCAAEKGNFPGSALVDVTIATPFS